MEKEIWLPSRLAWTVTFKGRFIWWYRNYSHSYTAGKRKL